MTKKETFINEINDYLEKNILKLSDDALTYFKAIQINEDKEKSELTEKGKTILKFMQENKEDYNNIFLAKTVGDGLNITSRMASGSMRKLCNDGYLEKIDGNPVPYSLTRKGIEVVLE